MICVVAKPFTGPKPKENKIIAVSKVVTWASNTGGNDRLYPSVIAAWYALTFVSSSLILS